MFRYTRYALLMLVATLAACGGGDNSAQPQYSISLTDIALNKKGSAEALAVNGLPAQSATLTGTGSVRPKRR